MLLVIDVGNTNIVIGLYEGGAITTRWRLSTDRSRTADEYGILFQQLFAMSGVDARTVDGSIVACVVPPVLSTVVGMVERYFGHEPLVVGPGLKSGMPILYENPREVGADRIVNAVAAYERFRSACIVVDLGTATTFDAIDDAGRYLGGAICPGITISAEALFMRASKLPRVDVAKPDRVVGRNTVASMQSGIVFGYCGLIDGMIRRIVDEYGAPMRTIATGGLSQLFAEECELVEEHDADLTLDGLRILWERNAAR
jgi:type III pantothenate kinase